MIQVLFIIPLLCLSLVSGLSGQYTLSLASGLLIKPKSGDHIVLKYKFHIIIVLAGKACKEIGNVHDHIWPGHLSQTLSS